MNKEERKAYNKKYRDEHQEEIKAYRIANKEKHRQASKIWREKNREKHKENSKKWRQNNPGKQQIATNKWRKNNPEKTKKYMIKSVRKIQAKVKKIRKEIKLNNGCLNPNCFWKGTFEACMLDFHHFENKKFNVGLIVSMKFFIEEIKKCTIICSNCHRGITHGTLNILDFKPIDTGFL